MESGNFLVESGDFLVESGDFLVESGDFLMKFDASASGHSPVTMQRLL